MQHSRLPDRLRGIWLGTVVKLLTDLWRWIQKH
jgi:hypothetical protein